ncbi:autotransporter assembly complex protein TamA [Devosia sp. XJ19-1]|uniref:Autotransporter assembly complex protein TamA n=2 Tax=Devosia ureilytica TaxID=2952754 RepID=A0A9Q4AQ61_9HYPH|nr:autotransporter assembly complex family protein [Devosia ureilytica]MCP8884065.1 autotransporter assembly complex protein TamA [Devosia ureilytica]MCP8887673.1 autotransporter assembly complex protein TamA [Devosia ureilytica]
MPAGAFELFGMKFFEDPNAADEDAVIVDPQPYFVTFTSSEGGGVEAALRNASALLADEAEPASGAAGLIAKARGDYRRLLAALYAEGHYGGAVSIRIGGVEAAKLAPDVKLPDPVDVTIAVTAGPLFTFGSVSIANQAPATNDPDDQVDLPVLRGFGAGEVARSTVILRAEQLALEAWRQQGYAKAEIVGREVVADHATNTVAAVITVNPGRLAAFGPVRVTGTTNMNPEFVAQQTGLAVGSEYDPDQLDRAQKRLDRLEVFRSARLEAAESIGSDGLLPYELIVEELPGRRFGFGATYSSVDGLGLEGYHLWRNLFGQAERLRLDARVASIGYPVDTSQFDYFVGGTFTKPGFYHPDVDLVATVSAERTIYPQYTETSAGGRVGLSWFFSDELTLEGGASFEIARFDDDFGTRDFQTAGVYAGIVYDGRDSSVDPTEGWYAAANLEPYFDLLGGKPGARLVVEGRTYFGFGEDDPFVLAGRLKAGAVLGPDLVDIPPDKLFFAGGGGSVRGYTFKSIGVDDGMGNITGGRYLLEASLEARAKVTNDIGVVGFVDGGYVAADTFPGLDDLRLGAGVGVRYYTGLGPLRLDVAVPLNKKAGDPDYAIYAGIGQAF